MPTDVRLENVTKSYGPQTVLRNLNLDVREGELVALLGASGCGKSTALRIIAGFLTPEEGRVLIGGQDYTYKTPNQRNTSMVFQSYALFPHMSVRENVAFGLKMHKVEKSQIKPMVDEILSAVRLEELGERYPRQLSGGQQQRVALARALVMRPDVLLLDEPLSNLDAKLRHEMRVEIRLLQERYGLTTIFVTHDQEEALTMSDRIMVMNKGVICQSGTPKEVFERPRSRFVADFTAVRNFMRGDFLEDKFVTRSGTEIRAGDSSRAPGTSCLGIRPGKIALNPPDSDAYANVFRGTVKIATFLGDKVEVLAVLPSGEEFILEVPTMAWDESRYEKGKEIVFGWKSEDMLYLTEEDASK